MKKAVLKLSVVAMLGGAYTVQAGFGDAVVGGVVGGVVGSVISNSVYHHGHSSHHYSSRHHRRRHVAPVETDEMKIQKALKSLGFYRGAIDGNINSFETRTAIKELNRAYEIDDTAYMSPQERDALVYLGTLLDFDKKLSAPGDSKRAKNKRIQTALKILGFYHGKIDGSTGPKTRRAIADYRMANGLGSGYKLGFEDEYRLITTARKANDKNIEDTIATLKRLGKHRNNTLQQSMNSNYAPAARNLNIQPQPAQQPQQQPAYNSPSTQQGNSSVRATDDGLRQRQQDRVIIQPTNN